MNEIETIYARGYILDSHLQDDEVIGFCVRGDCIFIYLKGKFGFLTNCLPKAFTDAFRLQYIHHENGVTQIMFQKTTIDSTWYKEAA